MIKWRMGSRLFCLNLIGDKADVGGLGGPSLNDAGCLGRFEIEKLLISQAETEVLSANVLLCCNVI